MLSLTLSGMMLFVYHEGEGRKTEIAVGIFLATTAKYQTRSDYTCATSRLACLKPQSSLTSRTLIAPL